jgi:ubiquitin C-terminal hydrolase
VLIITLKRYNIDEPDEKGEEPIDYPLTNLDLTKYFAEAPTVSACYNLCAILVHEGDLEEGHYYAFGLN